MDAGTAAGWTWNGHQWVPGSAGAPGWRQPWGHRSGGFGPAYGWSSDLSDEDILASIVSLNAQRSAEEHAGSVRWLRPEFQAPQQLAVQTALTGIAPVEDRATTRRKQPWPATLSEQVRAVKDSLRAAPMQNVQQIAAGFKPASRTRVAEILETLTALGQTRHIDDRYSL